MTDPAILVIDDDEPFSDFLNVALNSAGYHKVRQAHTISSAYVEVENSKPDLLFMDVNIDEAFSGISLANSLQASYGIPSIFITGSIDEETITNIEQTNPYGLLLKPFTIPNMKLVLNIALKRITLEVQRTSSEAEIHKSNEKLRTQLRELDAFFKISQAIEERNTIEDFIGKTLEIIPTAFANAENISTRMFYKGKEFHSPAFEESQWVLSEHMETHSDGKNLIELHLLEENSEEKFPFSLEDIQTFSAINKQISNKLHRVEVEESLELQLNFRNLVNELFQVIISLSGESSTGFLKEFTRIIGENFSARECEIILRKNSHLTRSVWKNGTVDMSRIQHGEEIYHSFDTPTTFDLTSGQSVPVDIQSIAPYKQGFLIFIPVFLNLKNAGMISIHLSTAPVHNFLENIDLVFIGDILAIALSKHQREKKLLIYKQAIEQNPASIVITDLKGNINYVNPRFTEVSGYTLKEARGENPRILKTGTQDTAFYKELWDTISNGNIWKGTFHNLCKNGETMWELAVICPIKNHDGKSTGYIAIKEDISNQIKTEQQLKELNKKLITAQATLVKEEKLASIGRLAAGVAHELNNPIGFIKSNTHSLKTYFGKIRNILDGVKESSDAPGMNLRSLLNEHNFNHIVEDIEAIFEENEEGFERVLGIINSLRSFSRIDNEARYNFYDLNQATETTLTIAGNELKFIGDVIVNYGEIPPVWCSAGEINQVLLNLIVNAAQAVDGYDDRINSLIKIDTYLEDEKACFKIQDSGPGIPPDIIDNIFDPFFTTKPIGKGTGLGLNISYDIVVNKHRGEIIATNSPEGGAVFTIRLPIGEENSEAES